MKKGRKKTKGRPNGGKHLREALRKRGSPRERDSRKKKYQTGNNPRQESSKKLRVKERRERKKERKKESGKTKRENTAGIGACISRPSFSSLLANPLFEVPQK